MDRSPWCTMETGPVLPIYLAEIHSTIVAMISIGGIKLSDELAQFNLVTRGSDDTSLSSYLKLLADSRINLTFLAMSQRDKVTVCNFCVAVKDSLPAKQILTPDGGSTFEVDMIVPVGTITIFPHQRNFSMLGKVVDCLAQADVPILAFGTSLSSLAINTDFLHIDRAVAALEKILAIPANHSPYRQEPEVKAVE